MSKRVMKDPNVMINGKNMSNHCLRVIVDHTPGNMTVAAITLYIVKITHDDEGELTYWFGELPDGV